MTNILNRYGDKRDLLFLLPRNSDKNHSVYSFYWPSKFDLRFAASLYNREPNILCNHARYNGKPMRWLFPKYRSRYITILREPASQFESVFNFMHFASVLGLKNHSDPLGTFLSSPRRFVQPQPKGGRLLLRNPMMFDLGYPESSYDNTAMVKTYITHLAREFDLVMIMEYFDESLILLKRTLCWQTEDVLYFKLNERLDKDKRQRDLSDKNKELIRKWNSADVMLYNYFNQTFWEKIKREGPHFYEELKTFRDKKKAMQERCLNKGQFLDEAYTGRYMKGYTLKQNLTTEIRETCERMIRNEISYVDYLREKMHQRIMDIMVQPPTTTTTTTTGTHDHQRVHANLIK